MMSTLAFQRPGLVTTGLLLIAFFGSLAAAIVATGWDETLAALGSLGPGHVALLLVLSLGNYAARALRWHFLAVSAGIPTRLMQNLRHYLGGFALTATPGRLGELVRLRWVGRETGWPIDRTAPLALADRASELAAVSVLLAVAVGLSTLGLGIVWPLILLSLALTWAASSPRFLHRSVTLAWRAIGRWARLFARLRRIAAGLAPFLRPRAALPALLLGGLGWFLEGLAFYVLLDWLGAPLPLWTAVAIFLAAMVSGALAGLPGGLGGAEAAMIALLALADVPLQIALPATAIIRATTLWFAILIGLGIFPLAEARSLRNRHPAP
ncbi:MAG: lysylphosphatidylglycerol synthase transmembrane domain-containing protein [Pseudomonadota bacterium]